MATEIKNAFGTANRHHTLATLNAAKSPLAPIAATMWKHQPTTMFFETANHVWTPHHIHEGLFQGECLSTSLFAITIQAAIASFRGKLKRNLPHTIHPTHILAYIDDVLIVTHSSQFPEVWTLWCQARQAANLQVQLSKCNAWIPANDATRTLHPSVADIVTQVFSGLPLLGSAADGDFSSHLHHETFQLNIHGDHPVLAPTKARLNKATQLATDICTLATLHLSCHAIQCAWLLTVRLLVYKLVFDCRISSPTHIAPFATALDTLIARCLSVISGHPTLTPAHLLQASLPRKLGGLFLTSTYHTAHIAPLASYL